MAIKQKVLCNIPSIFKKKKKCSVWSPCIGHLLTRRSQTVFCFFVIVLSEFLLYAFYPQWQSLAASLLREKAFDWSWDFFMVRCKDVPLVEPHQLFLVTFFLVFLETAIWQSCNTWNHELFLADVGEHLSSDFLVKESQKSWEIYSVDRSAEYECGALRRGCMMHGSLQKLHLVMQGQNNASCSKEPVFRIAAKNTYLQCMNCSSLPWQFLFSQKH